MRINVDHDQCEANGICVGIDADVFELDDEDMLHILEPEVTPQNERRLQQAIDSCPRNALRFEG